MPDVKGIQDRLKQGEPLATGGEEGGEMPGQIQVEMESQAQNIENFKTDIE